jgi:ABC-2 type transport system ATP-binding protein
VLRVETSETEIAAGVLSRLGLADIAIDPAHLSVSAQLGGRAPDEVNRELVGAGVPVRGLAVLRPGLEDLFVTLTGEGFDVVE